MTMAVRALIFAMLFAALLLPKASAVLAAMIPGAFQTIVICTGAGLQTITLGPDGAPIETTDQAPENCTLFKASLTPALPDQFWQALAHASGIQLPRSLPTQPEKDFARRRLARAPPFQTV
ncbi:hypothetical protein COL8621_00855 [Actibacterium lipolyticum]|uniref:DUF2946 domain-containing protein n=1 Tax=Actibacterium lipolyticum TaxID=1524263 RepID=A0A238JQX2_9RHOB|nr:hypothetical protein COL8621_00855 [Actibacterium lipolyticum]